MNKILDSCEFGGTAAPGRIFTNIYLNPHVGKYTCNMDHMGKGSTMTVLGYWTNCDAFAKTIGLYRCPISRNGTSQIDRRFLPPWRDEGFSPGTGGPVCGFKENRSGWHNFSLKNMSWAVGMMIPK